MIRMLRFIFTFLVFYATAFAQDEPLRVETNLVSVNLAIRDANGKYVKGLQQEQFEVFDSRQKQQIAHFSAEEAPVTYFTVYHMHPTTAERTKAVSAHFVFSPKNATGNLP